MIQYDRQNDTVDIGSLKFHFVYHISFCNLFGYNTLETVSHYSRPPSLELAFPIVSTLYVSMINMKAMNFKIEVLDEKDLQDAQWVLCKGNLMDYLVSLKPSFYDYIIQRKIVKNRYLNSIVNTVVGSEPLPIITLTSIVKIGTPSKGKVISLDMEKVEILDGLQRTFRLWAYSRIIQEFKKNRDLSPIDFSKALKVKYPEFFDSGIVNLTKIKSYYNDDSFDTIENAFKNFDVYFFLWNGLTPGKVIHKMLVLNAGQRPVSLAHQYELLFLYVLEKAKRNRQ
jgi:hypothetical protein